MIRRVVTATLLTCGIAFAQTPAPAKPSTFEVVSIHLNKTGQPLEVVAQDGPTADGFRSHQTLLLSLMTAYVPQVGGAAFYSQDQIKGLPEWLLIDRYDVDARISDEDRAEWRKPGSQKVLLRAMLQAMLADRCKLAVHREVKETRVTTLLVAKGGPRLKETDPTAEHAGAQKLPLGGLVAVGPDGMSFYDVSMASLASFVSSLANQGQPVQDRTGLTGRYDFIFRQPPGSTDTGMSPLEAMFRSGLNNLGLKLDSQKGQLEMLVIDHMEKPSEN